MGKNLRQILCVLGLLGLGSAFAQTGDDPPPSKGKVAILANDRIMEGAIERVGDQYRVRRETGETWLSADKVRYLCNSLEAAHEYLRKQTNVQDPDEILRLARWCLVHGLRSQALAEATAALELRPKHAESQRLTRALQRSLAMAVSPAAVEPRDDPVREVNAPAQGAYNPASLSLFVTKVQPILMNTCASCHATGKGGAFKLLRGYDDGTAGMSRTTQHNLMAVLAQLDRRQPSESPLLSKATLIHSPGAEQPPIRDRNAAAYRTLDEWVKLALATVPKPAAPPVAAPAVVALPKLPADAKPQATQQPVEARVAEESPSPTGTFASPPPVQEQAPPPANEPADEFDAMIFNRQMHRK